MVGEVNYFELIIFELALAAILQYGYRHGIFKLKTKF